ncbi:MAG: type II toxin-antitoxin system RatA family toxin [Xanthomonadales bacterium]|nr:type II toxin-antitoxin system RatA family toxin [Gammaproteobacteria bacterium]MBT8053192.1 type II toxin-antitoxin system RatA family toxin [Gammaproteobacteria bacterium]NND57669.1 type II toxin-antitoxin system RatA family toxin [Xanthomonadales bacterium]NNK50231.1 type II toxin-antitoxin system RatA family toxin [Xanthomonadales bacterium]
MLAAHRIDPIQTHDMEIKRTALVLHPAMDMFRLVRDVPAYPQFLSWCLDAKVHEQTPEHQLASLVIKVSGVTQTFTTRNRLVPGERLTLSLVEGPFKHLSGEWLFDEIGSDGSKITLVLGFDFSSKVISSAFRRGFTHIADRLVQDFSKRADQVYGS